jgi:exosortase/archaeosortase family protein
MHTIPLSTRARHELRIAEYIEALPPATWLLLQLLALWPSLAWAARRLADGSDEPLGLAALALLGVAAATGRLPLQRDPRLAWLAAALALSVAATALLALLPPLALSSLAALAIGCAYAAFRAPHAPRLPVLGLLLLALPFIASLQFYAGYPLRVVTAEATRWLLTLGDADVLRQGALLVVAGREVLVDAPCSGVQLAWCGYCAACAAALWRGLPDARFVARLPLVGAIALAGNVVRNTLLVAVEARLVRVQGAWVHEAVGLAVLAAVTLAVVATMREPR